MTFVENPLDRRAWQATVHGVTRVRHGLVAKPPPLPSSHQERAEGRELLRTCRKAEILVSLDSLSLAAP